MKAIDLNRDSLYLYGQAQAKEGNAMSDLAQYALAIDFLIACGAIRHCIMMRARHFCLCFTL